MYGGRDAWIRHMATFSARLPLVQLVRSGLQWGRRCMPDQDILGERRDESDSIRSIHHFRRMGPTRPLHAVHLQSLTQAIII